MAASESYLMRRMFDGLMKRIADLEKLLGELEKKVARDDDLG